MNTSPFTQKYANLLPANMLELSKSSKDLKKEEKWKDENFSTTLKQHFIQLREKTNKIYLSFFFVYIYIHVFISTTLTATKNTIKIKSNDNVAIEFNCQKE